MGDALKIAYLMAHLFLIVLVIMAIWQLRVHVTLLIHAIQITAAAIRIALTMDLDCIIVGVTLDTYCRVRRAFLLIIVKFKMVVAHKVAFLMDQELHTAYVSVAMIRY